MGKSQISDPPNLKKYGVPFYSVAWIPHRVLKSRHNQTSDESSAADQSSTPTKEAEPPTEVNKLGTGSELPYRMALHPNGDGIICAMPNSCRWFDWDQDQNSESHKVGLKTSEKELTQLQDVGQQLALAFSSDGTELAVGGEDGNLRVFKWPSMEIILNESKSHSTVKDLHFSSDGKLLVSLGSGGPCRVWDISSSIVLTSLPNENRETFSCCRFSQISDGTQVLYIAVVTDKGGSILTWNTKTWERMSSKHITRDTISALNVSADGKYLACGTPSGDIVVVNSTNMRIHTMVKRAHLGIVTALAFSPDSRALASISLDSSARVTKIEEKKEGMYFIIIPAASLKIYCPIEPLL
ncbi:hypothetical protein Ahy_B04g070825 isoform C [Arachis hypogaea]|uniref:Uncharacterized protein n=1 Tax=Arachis hypogaea TaxID=3818 RepID=A0A444ZJ59_ARAHY|nr:hypothetical protein Ahy_B04g070825 isoform C [Arachis hypogaea]